MGGDMGYETFFTRPMGAVRRRLPWMAGNVFLNLMAFAMRGCLLLGLVAGTALGVNVIVAGVVGGCLPFLIKRLDKDPAMMTGPLLTTITDVTGVTIYLGLSSLFILQLAA